jgi:drug/metabolite transporter (DMT)-like permease
MNLLKAFLLKGTSALLFAMLSACVRFLGDSGMPLGQVVFSRAFFAILPVLLMCAWQHQLAQAFYTKRPLGHLTRGLISIAGMFLNFAALARLPLVDATAISFAAPLITVAMAALLLGERVRIYRWSAVIVGFAGVLVMLVPHLDLAGSLAASAGEAIGAVLGLTGAFFNAASVIQTRHLTKSESTSAIVFYFSLICAVGGLITWPFGWNTPSAPELAALIGTGICGGVGHIVLTESYRFAPASLVAPFDYTSMLWALVLGYVAFGELPTAQGFLGGAIIVTAGLFLIWRERQLGVERVPPTALAPTSVSRETP